MLEPVDMNASIGFEGNSWQNFSSLLLEIFTDEGVGTQIVRPDSIM